MKVIRRTHRETKEGKVETTKFASGISVRCLKEPSPKYLAQQEKWQTELNATNKKIERRKTIEAAMYNKAYRETEDHLVSRGIIEEEE